MRLFSILIILSLSIPLISSADEIIGFYDSFSGPADTTTTINEMRYHPMDDFFFAEAWFFMGIFTNGYSFNGTVIVTNTALRKFTPAVEFSIFTPEGRRINRKEEFSPRELEASEKEFFIKVDKNSIYGDENMISLKFENRGAGLDLKLERQSPGFKPGSGRVFIGSERKKFWNYVIPYPSARVRGTIEIDGKKIEVEGRGFHDHSLQNIPNTSYSTNWLSTHIFADNYTINALEFSSSEKYNGKRICMIMLSGKGKTVFSSDSYNINYLEHSEPDEFKNVYPTAVLITASDEDIELRIKIKTGKSLEKIDILGSLNPVTRSIIKTFIAKPMIYRFSAKAEIELKKDDKKEVLEGFGTLEVDFME